MRRISDEERTSTARIDLAEYWRLFWRKKHFLLLPPTLAGLVAVVGVRFIVPVYKSSSLIAIEDQTYLSREVEQFVPTSARRRVQDEDTLEKLAAELRSTAFLDELINHLGIAKNPDVIASAKARAERQPGTSLEDIVLQRLRGRLKSKFEVSLAGPGMFRISAYDYSSEASYVLADAATKVYIAFQRKKQLKGLEEAGAFGDEQLHVYKQRLQDSEANLENLERQFAERETEDNLVTVPGLRYAETMRQQLLVKIGDVEAVVARLLARIRSVMGELPNTGSIWQDPELKNIRSGLIAHRETLLRLELEGRFVVTRSWEENKSGILEDEEALQRRLSFLVTAHHAKVDPDQRPLLVEYLFQVAQLDSYNAQLLKLESHIATFQRRQSQLPEMQMQLSRLREQVRTDRELYNSFLRAKTSTQISQALQQTGLSGTIEVMEEAKPPSGPVKPNKRAIMVLALLFGLGLGVGGLVLSEYSDTSFRKVEDIEQVLGLKVLGTIPHFESGAKWHKQRRQKRTLVWTAVSIAVVVVSLFGFYYYGKAPEKTGDTRLSKALNAIGRQP